MLVRVYFVGWMRAVAAALWTDGEQLELRDTVPAEAAPVDEGAEDRDTWPEAGLARPLGYSPVRELRIELAGSRSELDVRAERLMCAIEREVRSVAADWDCRIHVTPHGKSV